MTVEPWTVKYRPGTSRDVAGNKTAIEKLREWIDSWSEGRPTKRAALLYGPAGVGKTTVSEALAQERGWDLVEINASDKRSGEILSKIAGLASTQSTLFSKGRLILLDEVDGVNLREDHGAITTILQIIKDTQYPLVLTANDPWDPKIRPLREACLQIELKRLGVRDGLPLLKSILSKEGVKTTDDALRFIIDKDRGDIRSILNDIQLLSGRNRTLTMDDVNLLSGRDRTESVFEVLRVIFNSRTVAAARRALSISDLDQEMLFQWIFENAPYQIPKPDELERAISALADADMYFARIRKTQSWHLLSYALDLMTAGVAVAKQTPTSGWVPMKFPQRISSMSRTRMSRDLRKRVGVAIGQKSHVSARRAQQLYLPLIRFAYEHSPEKFEQIAVWLEAKDELNEMLSAELK
ncbi:replication factor C large subunit [Candidatus Bathyarchaeota archaeon]|nr:MAG: replication factor C large subunit [Candidatus Bathyarchaeota archaeon]TMI53958.1 MAG: replication factor C large subunit [Candidatus Bathyarchaeota archaeon]